MENRYPTFINRLGKRLFGVRPSSACKVPPAANEEIPRYPPFMKGLPAAPVERILSTQTELIQAIEQALALPDDLYQAIALPVIARYAAFSHLLPASESHHHRGAGGLFRHGLEVAHWATMASQSCLFATHATPRERKSQELRWRLAVCFAGLLHDIGKPVSDMAVVDRQGKHTWNPCDENLTDWAAQNQIDRYFLRWRENRHKRHEQFSALVIERVLTRPSRSYILEPGPDIMQAMLETIHGLDRGTKLYELVVSADCKSVERDLKAHHHSVDSAMGMPVEKYLFDAMRRLIKSGQWNVNEKGARLWRFQEGIHIVWRTGAQDIVGMLAKDKVPGIPRDEDTLADILIERGLAIPKSLTDGRKYRYWRMQPQGMEAALYMLRLSSIEFLYSNEPPVVVAGIEMAETAEAEHELHTASNDRQHMPITVNPTASVVTSRPKSARDKAIITTNEPNHVEGKLDLSDPKPSVQVERSSAITAPKPRQNAEVLEDGVRAGVLDQNSEPASPVANEGDKANLTQSRTKHKPKNSPQPTQAITDAQASSTKVKPVRIEDQQITSKKWLQEQGQAGEWLLQIVSEINQGQWRRGVDFLETQDKFLLAFPGTAEMLKLDSNHFIKTLEEKGWLVVDVLSPLRKVQIIDQVRGVVLSTEPAEKMKLLLTGSGQSITSHQITKQPEQAKTQIRQAASVPLSKATESQGKPKSKPNKPASKQTPTIETRLPYVQSDDSVSNQDDAYFELIPASCYPQDGFTENQQADSTEKPSLSVAVADVTVATHKPDYQQAIKSLIEQVQQVQRQSKPTEILNAKQDDWCIVSDAEIEQYLDQHPNLQRTRFMLDISRYPGCQNLGLRKGFKVRVKP